MVNEVKPLSSQFSLWFSTHVRSWISHLLLWLAVTLTEAVQIYHSMYYSFMANRVPVSIQIRFDRK